MRANEGAADAALSNSRKPIARMAGSYTFLRWRQTEFHAIF